MKLKSGAFLLVLMALVTNIKADAMPIDRLCASTEYGVWSVDPDACINPLEQYRVSLLNAILINRHGYWSMDFDGEIFESVEDIYFCDADDYRCDN